MGQPEMAGASLSLGEIDAARGRLWRTAPGRHIRSEREALQFISELGFVLLMPITGAELPNIHEATGGDWSRWWDWKQTLPERQRCYYAKLLRGRGVFVSWEWFPAFYAAYSEGQPYWRLYREGLLSEAEKRILDLLDGHGPMMTRELRLAFGPRGRATTRLVKQKLVELQRRLLVCPAGGSTEGWSHHRWDLVERWVPADVLAEARRWPRPEARRALLRQHIRNMLATTAADAAWVFGWERRVVAEEIEALVAAGVARRVVVAELEGEVVVPQPWPAFAGSRAK